MKRRPIILATGGTGGHVFPAEALASELLGRGRSLVLVTDARGSTFSGTLGRLPVYSVHAGTPSQGGIVARVHGLIATARGTLQARRMLEWLQPAVVVGFGGYASLPTMLAATSRRIPTVVHEQNAVLGRANRLVAPRVSSIALTFPATAKLRSHDHAKAEIVGNPVRVEIRALRANEYVPASTDGLFNLLVLGGSQGASIFATLLPEALGGLPAQARARLRVVQQCRPEDIAATHGRYKAAGVIAELSTFFSDVPRHMAAAHLMVTRSGASTVSEISVAGRPAIMVPFPFAADDHQAANARALSDSAAAWTFVQRELTAGALRDHVARLMTSPDELVVAARNARGQARPDAARALANLVEEVLAGHAPLQLAHSDDRLAGEGGAA